MKRRHAVAVALMLGLAAVAGMVAATRTAGLGAAAAPATSNAAVARRSLLLDRAEQALRRERARRPPALPALPAAASARPQRLVFVRPRPVVVTVHRSHGDDHEGVEHDSEAADD